MSTSQVPLPPRPPQTGQTYWEKGWEKCKQQPFVPIGIFATCVAFVGATHQLRAGNKQTFNRFLRFRVIAQGVTIAACVIGSYVYGQQGLVDKANARAEEVEKIRLAGTRAQREQQQQQQQQQQSPASPSEASTSAPDLAAHSTPSTPPAGETFWAKWGISSRGKEP